MHNILSMSILSCLTVCQNFVRSGPIVNSLELRPHVLFHHPLGQTLVQVLPLCVDGQFLQ